MTSIRTPKQKAITLTKQEAELIQNFRSITPEIQVTLCTVIGIQARHYQEKVKPHLTLVKVNSLRGGRHA